MTTSFGIMQTTGGEKSKALAIFLKLLEGRPDDNIARYSIKQLNTVE